MFFTIVLLCFLLILLSVIGKGYRVTPGIYVVAGLVSIIPVLNCIVALLAAGNLTREAYKR